MQLRLDQEQVTDICRALAAEAHYAAPHDQRDRAARLHAWLEWRAAKLWGVADAGELERERAS